MRTFLAISALLLALAPARAADQMPVIPDGISAEMCDTVEHFAAAVGSFGAPAPQCTWLDGGRETKILAILGKTTIRPPGWEPITLFHIRAFGRTDGQLKSAEHVGWVPCGQLRIVWGRSETPCPKRQP